MIVLLLACDGEPEKQAETNTPSETDSPPVTDSDTDTDTQADSDCPAERRVDGTLVGAVAVDTSVRVAAIDASNWRFGDAVDVSDVAHVGSLGEFTLCLDEAPTTTFPFLKAFVAAWLDVDGDDRFDARAESLCDDARADGGWTFAYLYWMDSGVAPGWTMGPAFAPLSEASAAVKPVLDGDRCER